MQKLKWLLVVVIVTIAAFTLVHSTGLNRVLMPATVKAAAPPVIAIASCNPTFVAGVAGGSYVVTANLAPAAGQICIIVNAPGVTINLNGHTLTGTGAAIGIEILPGMAGAHIIGPGAITAFTTGIVDAANSALLENLTIKSNLGNGIVMTGVDGSVLDTSAVVGNGANGVYLLNTRDCIVKYNVQIANNGTAGPGYSVWIQNNAATTLSFDNIVAANVFGPGGPQLAGIWVGLNNNAPLVCGAAAAPSTGNILVDNQNINANVVVGIGLQCPTATNNTVTDNHNVAGNGAFDLFDGNAACDANSWVADIFGTKNQACVN
jgi:Right handed beta helix region